MTVKVSLSFCALTIITDDCLSSLTISSFSFSEADFAGENNPLYDGNGHGTHVAGTTVGLTYGKSTTTTTMQFSLNTTTSPTYLLFLFLLSGVAYCNTSGNGCELCPIKVLDSRGSGSFAGVIAGIDHAAADCLLQAPTKQCVLNMSLGGGKSVQVNDAVKNAVAKGVTVVVAAGNDNANACNYSPASAEDAITVGATQESETTAPYSNYGSCVDFWAPGSSIKSAWIGSITATRTISGTSMASPSEYALLICYHSIMTLC